MSDREARSFRIEIAASVLTQDQLAALGGLARAFGWSDPVVRPVVAPEHQRHNPLFEAEPQRRLDTPLSELDPGPDGTLWAKTMVQMKRAGLDTVRHALTVGGDFIGDRRNVGAESVKAAGRVLGLCFPQYPLSAKVPPQELALFCPTLRHVTWLALQAGDYYVPFDYVGDGSLRPSLQDVLDRPYAELGLVARDYFEGDQIAAQTTLTHNARRFVEPYHAALALYAVPEAGESS